MDVRTSGWINGFLGVLIFSGSLPATRVAVSTVIFTLRRDPAGDGAVIALPLVRRTRRRRLATLR